MCFEKLLLSSVKKTPGMALGKEDLCRVFFLLSVFYLALGKELLYRVLEKKHSANHVVPSKESDSGSASQCHIFVDLRALHAVSNISIPPQELFGEHL
jgi:hypothetical protein